METKEKQKPFHQGENVKNWRRTMGVTQIDVAELLNISQQTLSRIEEKDKVDDETLIKIAKVLKIPVETLKNVQPQQAINKVINNNYTNSENIQSYNDNAHNFNFYYFGCNFYGQDGKKNEKPLDENQEDAKSNNEPTNSGE